MTDHAEPRHDRWVAVGTWFLIFVVAYLAFAYGAAPLAWRRYEARHPALENAPTITHTKNGIPGDPLNVALIGSETLLHPAMLAAGWDPADPITLESSLRIAAGTVLRRPYDDAPVSDLFLFGRKQDLAFEKPIGHDPRKRHHVRFWKADKVDELGRPLWIGAVTYDSHVGLSHTTGQITHHIGPDIDAERDLLLGDLRAAGWLSQTFWVNHFQEPPEGRNGGGDPWHTDGRLGVGILLSPGAVQPAQK